MSTADVPFNVTLLDLTEERIRGLKPVRSLDIMEGNSSNFSEDGLYSVSIFGRVGDERRSRRFSYIDTKITIFHPVIFRALMQLKRFYIDIIAGKGYAIFDEEIKDFVKSNAVDGFTGFQFFVEHWQKIQHEHKPSDIREQNIKLLEKFKGKSLTSKVIVLPAGLRDLEITGDGRVSESDINKLYRRLLSLSNAIPPAAVKNNPEILNTSRYSLQIAFNDIYELLEGMIDGKKKLMMGKWASRKVFNGTRNVITSTSFCNDNLGEEGGIGLNNTMVGLYQFLKGTLPISKFNIKTGFLSKVFTGPNNPVTLVNKTTLRTEHVQLKSKYYDSWMTEEGLDKVITAFGEESIRHKELEIEGYWLGLIYKGPDGSVKLFQDISELPENFDKQYVSPITFCELMYLSVYHFSDKTPVFVTRFPITGFGSIYPSMTYLKPTTKTEKRFLLNDYWERDIEKPIIPNFPTKTSFVNSLSPSSTHLGLLGADFDGDTCSGTFVYTDEAVSEVKQYLQSKKYYVGTSGRLNFSIGTDTVKFVLKNMTGN